MNNNLKTMLLEAMRLTRAGRLHEATRAIQRALGGAGTPPAHAADPRATSGEPPAPPPREPRVFDMEMPAFTEAAVNPASEPLGALAPAPAQPQQTDGSRPAPGPVLEDIGEALPDDEGQFIRATLADGGQLRAYKLYVPPRHAGEQLPLVVMLHGCTQDPDDFAAGTGMNQRAREQGFFVLYPEQPRSANPSRCWSWFMREHQRRGAGEPALIAGMTREVLQQHDVDPRRVYIAGLSAGGAMAAIVAAAYPEIYAAVGVHSGLPRGAASNMMGALSVMKSGVASPDMFAGAKHFAFAGSARADPQVPVPTIVFHGDQDRTVHPRNSEQLIAAVLEGAAEAEEAHSDGADGPLVEQGVSGQGQRYTRSTHQGRNGSALAEHWLVHGAGHAWSGGQAEGSYTDDKGPDATGEMLRFFFAQPHGPAH